MNLKYARLEQLKPYDKFTFIKGDISDKDMITKLFEEHKPNIVVKFSCASGCKIFN